VTAGMISYLFGPRLNCANLTISFPFAEFLVGGTHAESNWRE